MCETLDGFSPVSYNNIVGVKADPPTEDFLVVFPRAEMICID